MNGFRRHVFLRRTYSDLAGETVVMLGFRFCEFIVITLTLIANLIAGAKFLARWRRRRDFSEATSADTRFTAIERRLAQCVARKRDASEMVNNLIQSEAAKQDRAAQEELGTSAIDASDRKYGT